MRCLEIGPGKKGIPGFETFNLGLEENTIGKSPDHVGDARKLPFDKDQFDIVYSSHCIEHVHWFEVEDTVKEWARVVKPNGKLEIWTVDGLKIMQNLLEYEATGKCSGKIKARWKHELTKGDPYLWLVGKLYNYPKKGDFDHQLHRALITPKYLKKVFTNAGLKNVRFMDRSEVRAFDHGWINLGVCGIK